jgi:hypothetical protein
MHAIMRCSLGLLLVATASTVGCATPTTARRGPDEGAELVVAKLHDAGFRFGTDGSTRALWGYMTVSHRVVQPLSARPGDVVFFDTDAPGESPSCDRPDHAGVVDRVTPEGRIAFVEARGGTVRTSFVDPTHPALRRDARGHVANSFLRPKRPADPPGTRYFAGEMLCGVARPANAVGGSRR